MRAIDNLRELITAIADERKRRLGLLDLQEVEERIEYLLDEANESFDEAEECKEKLFTAYLNGLEESALTYDEYPEKLAKAFNISQYEAEVIFNGWTRSK